MSSTLSNKDYTQSIIILATLFFVFGFISWSNAILIPYFKIAFELTSFRSYLVAFAFYISYLLFSLPSSVLLIKYGYKKSIVLGLWIMAIGALIFIPSALQRSYSLFLVGLFTLGTGLSVLQTASNPYITSIGPIERATQRISIMGICNKSAGIIAPLILSFIILNPNDANMIKNIGDGDLIAKAALQTTLLNRVIVPYLVIGAALFLLGAFIFYSSLPEIQHESIKEVEKKSILSHPALVLGAIAIFFHVGTQVIAVDTIINYAMSKGVSLIEAKIFPSYVLTMTIVGYFIGIVLTPKWISQLTALRAFSVMGLIFSIFIVLAKGNVSLLNFKIDISIWFIVLLGLANSLIWAGIWPLAIKDLGPLTKLGSSIMIMALCGNAIMPLVYGYFADIISMQWAYFVLVPSYLYIIFYAYKGHTIKKWELSSPG